MPRLKLLERKGELRWLDYLPQRDVIALLQSALSLVFVSLYEGFGLPVLEAFAAGCPVIASNTTSLPEVASDAAMLVNPVDPDQLAQAMILMIENIDIVDSYRYKGFQRVKKYSWEASAKSTFEVYQMVLSSKS